MGEAYSEARKLEQKVNRTPQEEEILQKEKQMQSRKEKVICH